jgi:phenylpropionate dioxygenase-like ring-hydroxylating dioxygenase large terminal subunit
MADSQPQGDIPTYEEMEAALRRAWYPVARSADLAEGPRSATLLDEDLVVFETEDGHPCVTSARCLHRGADLTQGCVRGDAIQCAYHGWRWRGEDGVCVGIPSAGTEGVVGTGKLRIAAYPAHERWGLVWTCLAEDPPDPPAPPPELEELELTYRCGDPIPHDCSFALQMENVRDVAHFPFVHRSTLGGLPHEVSPIPVRREGTEVWATYDIPAQQPPEGEDTANTDIYRAYRLRAHAMAPAFTVIVFEVEGMGSRLIINAPSPVGRYECVVYPVFGFDGAFTEEFLDSQVAIEMAIFLEDRDVLDRLKPKEIPFGGEVVETSTASDRYTGEYRKALLEFYRQG